MAQLVSDGRHNRLAVTQQKNRPTPIGGNAHQS
jgi:hypothetical protein